RQRGHDRRGLQVGAGHEVLVRRRGSAVGPAAGGGDGDRPQGERPFHSSGGGPHCPQAAGRKSLAKSPSVTLTGRRADAVGGAGCPPALFGPSLPPTLPLGPFASGVVSRSPLPDVDTPDVALTSFVLEHAASTPGKPALVEAPTSRAVTYGDVVDGIRRVAAGLSRRGFGKGDVLTIYSPNLPEYPIPFHGVASAGGAVHPANPLLTADELRFQLTDSRARFLVTVPALLGKAREAAEGTRVEDVFVIGEESFADLLASEGEPPTVAIDPA